MEKSNAVLHLENVYKSFGGLKVLQGVDLIVRREEIVGLIGPNGAGKSTVINVITSLYKPDRGSIYFSGKKINGLPPYRICQLGIARTYQLVRAFLKMTVLENVMLASTFGKIHDGRNAYKRALEALEFMELSPKKEMLVEHLTLSDRRLLEIAMALSSTPTLALLDEPMAGLNTVEVDNLLQIIERVRSEKKLSILWIEHDVDAIFNTCDRVLVLDHGIVIADGDPDEVARNSKVMEAYLGEPIA